MATLHKYCLEYVWLDAFGNARSKIKIISKHELLNTDTNTLATTFINLSAYASENSSLLWDPLQRLDSGYELGNVALHNIPIWNFDGSSTGQATGKDSDIILRPVRIYNNPLFINTSQLTHLLILCECYEKTYQPHPTNHRFITRELQSRHVEEECLFGMEQEYVLFERTHGLPYKWCEHNEPGIGGQGPYYCSAGGDRAFGRNITNEHLLACLQAGVEICGTNAEVMASQWEFQVGATDPVKVCDDLVVARYLLCRITEKYNCCVSFHPKPYLGDWNGSGCHTNFSTWAMRRKGGFEHIMSACKQLQAKHNEHIEVYGEHNSLRLTGAHETSPITEFTWGVGNRGCSVRIPLHVFHQQRGYLEDRRPASNCNPYQVVNAIVSTVCGNVCM